VKPDSVNPFAPETIAWLVSPASGGVNGNVVRVCGQQLLGA